MTAVNFDPPVPLVDALQPVTGVPAEVMEVFAGLDVTAAEAVATQLGLDEPGPVVLFALRCGATLRETER